MLQKIFDNLKSYKSYLSQNPFHKELEIDLNNYGELNKKHIQKPFHAVDPNLDEAFPAELDDLIRIHYLVTSRKVTTILEFGIGKSTLVFENALQINKGLHKNYVANNLRRSNPFECHSVDNNKKWIDFVKKNSKTDNVIYHKSKCRISTFNGRICTYFDPLPNVCPDLIYLDGPDQFSPEGDIRGVNTNHSDRLPMSADILAIEHFLLPGTLIVVDGRTANARFLLSNFQRKWSYWHSFDFDQHFFELKEEPLGIFNKRQIDYCLGESFYNNLK